MHVSPHCTEDGGENCTFVSDNKPVRKKNIEKHISFSTSASLFRN